MGKIVQGFKNTAYIKISANELICLTSYQIRAEMNLNFKGDLDFRDTDYNHAPVIKIKEGLRVKETEFDISSSRQYLRKKQFDIKNGFRQRALFATRVLSFFDLSGSIVDSQSPFFKSLSYSIKALLDSVREHDFNKTQEYVPSLVGLGNGFTPSGDDFLVGFLFCLNQLLHCRGQTTTNFNIKGSTNWVSKKFIEYSQAGYVIEPVEKFVVSLFEQNDEVIISALTNLIRIGHSSGIDTAVGILFATALDGDQEFCDSVYTTLSL